MRRRIRNGISRSRLINTCTYPNGLRSRQKVLDRRHGGHRRRHVVRGGAEPFACGEDQAADQRLEREFYRARIEQDSTLLERLRYDDYLEEYARENYHMQRSDEHVYIIKE